MSKAAQLCENAAGQHIAAFRGRAEWASVSPGANAGIPPHISSGFPHDIDECQAPARPENGWVKVR